MLKTKKTSKTSKTLKTKKSWTNSFVLVINFFRFSSEIIYPDSNVFRFFFDKNFGLDLLFLPPSNIKSKKIKLNINPNPNTFSGEWIWNKDKISSISNHCMYILYLHGGAFCMGNCDSVRNFLCQIALENNVVILSLDYRRAPEYKYPIPLEDCVNAYLNLREFVSKHNSKHNSGAKIIIMGDSAGGNLALSVIAELIKINGVIPDGCVGISPWVDLTDYGENESNKSSWETNTQWDFVKADLAKYFALEYINQTTTTLEDVSPQFFPNDILRKFPPTLIEYGECEVLQTQIHKFALKLENLGIDIQSNCRYDMVHDFPLFYFTKIPQADDFFISVKKFIKKIEKNN